MFPIWLFSRWSSSLSEMLPLILWLPLPSDLFFWYRSLFILSLFFEPCSCHVECDQTAAAVATVALMLWMQLLPPLLRPWSSNRCACVSRTPLIGESSEKTLQSLPGWLTSRKLHSSHFHCTFLNAWRGVGGRGAHAVQLQQDGVLHQWHQCGCVSAGNGFKYTFLSFFLGTFIYLPANR